MATRKSRITAIQQQVYEGFAARRHKRYNRDKGRERRFKGE